LLPPPVTAHDGPGSGDRGPAAALRQVVDAELDAWDSPPVESLAREVRNRYGDGVAAILFYGSCLRSGCPEGDGLFDLYVVVDDYRSSYASRWLATLNAALPPNVFYLQTHHRGRRLHAKYAVVSIRDLLRGTSLRSFQSYWWARLAQPCGLLYARDHGARRVAVRALAQAVVTYLSRTTPLMQGDFAARDLWRRALAESYRAELRPERLPAIERLVMAAPRRYEAVTQAAAQVTTALTRTEGGYRARVTGRERWQARQAWRLRRLQGKTLNLLRLAKAALFTFDGGLDYATWKIERHAGVRLEPPPWVRRHPRLGTLVMAWRVYRRGVLR